MAWNSDGTKLATVGRDESIKIYDPRSSTSPIAVCCHTSVVTMVTIDSRKHRGLVVVMVVV